jgi:hypothetical protein
LLVLGGKIYDDFIRHLDTDRTRQLYKKALIDYAAFLKIDKLEDLLTLKNIQQSIINYLDHLTDQNYSYSHRNIAKSAIAYFYMRQDILNLNWKKISQSLGTHNKPRKDRPYTLEELKKLLDISSSLMVKSLITLLLSTGVRLGAPGDLNRGHLKEVENLYRITVYEGTEDEYDTFCSPECRYYIDQYLAEREKDGEKITDDSPLFRREYNRSKGNKNVKRLGYSGVKSIIQRLRLRAGFTTPNRRKEPRGSKFRYPTSLTNSFRKAHYNALSEAGVRTTIIEKLAGRDRSTIAGRHYHRPADPEMLSQYRKAINNLTIDAQFRLQEKIDTIEKKQQAEIDYLKNEIYKLSQEHPDFELLKKEMRQELQIIKENVFREMNLELGHSKEEIDKYIKQRKASKDSKFFS